MQSVKTTLSQVFEANVKVELPTLSESLTAVQGYRTAIALMPDKDIGVVLLWNSESALPSGLLPTILDNVLGLAGGQWIDEDVDLPDETLYANQPPAAGTAPTTVRPAGVDSSKATASPF